MAQARHNTLWRLSLFVIPLLASFLMLFIWPQSVSATGGSQNRPPYNTPEQNAYNSCVSDPDGSGSWQARRYGAIWVTNGSYYAGSVNVNAPDNSVAVRIRGSVFGCHHTSTGATYAVNISPTGANGWRLTGLSDTSLFRGNSQGRHNWSTQGGEISANLNVSGLATNNQYGPATETIIIELYRCFSTNSSSATGKCYVEPVPVTVTRAADPAPEAYLDDARCDVVYGWAADRSNLGVSLHVYIYVDGAFAADVLSNRSRPDVQRYLGSPWDGYGFEWIPPPQYRDGRAHTVNVYALGIDSSGNQNGNNPQLNYSPKTIFCPSSFVITPTANPPLLAPDSEAPTSARFVSGLTVEVTPPTGNGVKATLTRRYYIQRGATQIDLSPVPGADNNGGAPFTTNNSRYNDTRTLPAVRLGDQICTSISTNPHRGTVDRDGNVTQPPTVANYTLPPVCTPVTNKPYLKVFGGSVWAGSKFNTSASACTSFTGGQIRTYARYNAGASFGSSAQYAAQALSDIVGNTADKGFYSGSQRTPPSATSAGYLTIANNGWTPPNWGGNMGGGRCLVDFFDPTAKNTRFSTTLPDPGASADINTLTNNSQYSHSGNFTLTASAPTSKRVTIFVAGDVSIPSNISYPGVYSPSDLDDPADPTDTDNIPYVTIIARGNIYVGRNVETLSGLYIAQPDTSGNKGEVFTCSNGFSAVAAANRFTDCNGPGGINPLLATCNGGSSGNNTGKPLTIYGAFIARKTHFDRTNGTLRCASPAHGVLFPELFTSEKMAEKFYLTPELYLGQPVFRSQAAENYSGFGDAQSYSNLPPIF